MSPAEPDSALDEDLIPGAWYSLTYDEPTEEEIEVLDRLAELQESVRGTGIASRNLSNGDGELTHTVSLWEHDGRLHGHIVRLDADMGEADHLTLVQEREEVEPRDHPIVSFDHYKVGGRRQGIIVDVRCPETAERFALPYGPENENVARCECGELITLGTCRPIQDARLSAYELDVADRNEEKRQAVADTLGVDPDSVGTRFQDRIPERFDTNRLCECPSAPPGYVSSEDPRFCGGCGGVLAAHAPEFGLEEEVEARG